MKTIYKRQLFWVLTFVLSMILISCGGGGGGSGSGSPHLSSAKAITQYSLIDPTDESKIPHTGKIEGHIIRVYVPFDMNLDSLVAKYTSTGVSVYVKTQQGKVKQTNEVTRNNFTKPVNYIVQAADGSTESYEVIVETSKNSDNSILSYAINGVQVEPSGQNIELKMPYGTNLDGLIASFVTTGYRVKVGDKEQKSGVTPNNFMKPPVIYKVFAANGKEKEYRITVTVAKSDAKKISIFSLTDNNSKKSNSVNIDQTNNIITVNMPAGSKIESLVAGFTTEPVGLTVKVDGKEQRSGEYDFHDFSNNQAVTYTVFAADGISNRSYTVTAKLESSSENTFDYFLLKDKSGRGGTGSIDSVNYVITVSVPYNTYVNEMLATFQYKGKEVKVGESIQISGERYYNNFSSGQLLYTVVADNGSKQNYTIKIKVSPVISYFALCDNSYIPSRCVDSGMDPNESDIHVKLPYDMKLNGLAAQFNASGEVTVKGVKQVSGKTPNNFESDVIYKVQAKDGNTKSYTVHVSKFQHVGIYTLYKFDNNSYIYMTFFNEQYKTLTQYNPSYIDAVGKRASMQAYTMVYDPLGRYIFTSQYRYDYSLLLFYVEMDTFVINSDGFLNKTIQNTHHSSFIEDLNRSIGKITVDPKGQYLYQIYNYDRESKSVIDTYIINQTNGGVDFNNNTTAKFDQGNNDMRITPDGNYIYVASGENNSIILYNINRTNGSLNEIKTYNSGGWGPQNLVIDPLGKYLYVYNSKIVGTSPRNITVFSIARDTGYLTAVEGIPLAFQPVISMLIDPKGGYLYVNSGGNITTYSINKDKGKLTQTQNFVVSSLGEIKSAAAMAIDQSGSIMSVVDANCNSHVYMLGINKIKGANGKLVKLADKNLKSQCVNSAIPVVTLLKDM